MEYYRNKLTNSVYEGYQTNMQMAVETGDGNLIVAYPGDYIMTNAYGSQSVVDKDVFLSDYVKEVVDD